MSSTLTARPTILACVAGVLALAACEVVGSIGGVDDLAAGGSDSATTTGGQEKLPEGPERPRDTDDAIATSSAGDMSDDASSGSSSDGPDVPNKLDLGDGGGTDSDTVGTFGVSCCTASDEPGCGEDPMLEACVCALDPYCCETAWDDTCVGIATWGECDSGCAGAETSPVDCCLAGDAAGCIDRQIAACVCEHDPYCCDVSWDDVCVGDVALNDCGSCP